MLQSRVPLWPEVAATNHLFYSLEDCLTATRLTENNKRRGSLLASPNGFRLQSSLGRFVLRSEDRTRRIHHVRERNSAVERAPPTNGRDPAFTISAHAPSARRSRHHHGGERGG